MTVKRIERYNNIAASLTVNEEHGDVIMVVRSENEEK